MNLCQKYVYVSSGIKVILERLFQLDRWYLFLKKEEFLFVKKNNVTEISSYNIACLIFFQYEK